MIRIALVVYVVVGISFVLALCKVMSSDPWDD